MANSNTNINDTDPFDPDTKLIAGHVVIMLVGMAYFDWRFISYLPFIVIYLLPVISQKYGVVSIRKGLN